MKLRNVFIGVLVGIALLFVVYRHGRWFWVPAYNKLTGQKASKTVASVIEDLTPKVKDQVVQKFEKAGLLFPVSRIVLIGIKDEKRLEVWGISEVDVPVYITEYKILAASGKSGPKLKEGDMQVPEGFYAIELLNPNSSYHLSMRVNYPNAFDKAMAVKERRTDLGGDIYIHGKAVSIGCLAIGDEAIEELFFISAQAKNITVILSPTDFRKKGVTDPVVNISWAKDLYRNIRVELAKLKI